MSVLLSLFSHQQRTPKWRAFKATEAGGTSYSQPHSILTPIIP